MEQIKEKKWWFIGAIGLMLVILLTGLLFNFSSVGKNLIEGIGKNATTKTVQISYDYLREEVSQMLIKRLYNLKTMFL